MHLPTNITTRWVCTACSYCDCPAQYWWFLLCISGNFFNTVFFFIYQSENNNHDLNTRTNSHSNNIRTLKCQQIPGGRLLTLLEWAWWNEQSGKTRGANIFALEKNQKEKNWPEQRMEKEEGTKVPAFYLFLLDGTAHKMQSRDN